jgi:hypothetical protein
MKTFLDLLPPELRNKIWHYVLSSPSGTVSLRRNSYYQPGRIHYKIVECGSDFSERPPEEFRLSFLRTCRQIYTECKDMFWDLNALDLEALLHESGRPGLLPDISPVGYQVRAVELDINFLARTMVRGDPRLEPKLALGKVLRGLAQWSYQGRLESITLNARNKFREESGDSLGHQSFREILLLRRDGEPNGISGLLNPTAREMLYHEYLDVLCRAGGKNGYLSHLKRNLVIDTLPQHNEGCKISEGDPNEMLDELNLAWGGHLIMNQDISHRDGNRVKDVFMKRLTPKGRGVSITASMWSSTSRLNVTHVVTMKTSVQLKRFSSSSVLIRSSRILLLVTAIPILSGR